LDLLSLAFSPDGRFLVVGGNKVVGRLGTRSGACRERWAGRRSPGQALSVCVSHDGRLLLTCDGGPPRTFGRMETGQAAAADEPGEHSLARGIRSPTRPSWASDITDRTGRYGSPAALTDVEGRQGAWPCSKLMNWGPRCFAFSPDGRLVAAGGGRRDGRRLGTSASTRRIARFEGHRSDVVTSPGPSTDFGFSGRGWFPGGNTVFSVAFLAGWALGGVRRRPTGLSKSWDPATCRRPPSDFGPDYFTGRLPIHWGAGPSFFARLRFSCLCPRRSLAPCGHVAAAELPDLGERGA